MVAANGVETAEAVDQPGNHVPSDPGEKPAQTKVSMTYKRIGISIGDAAGIGPELALRLASRIDEFPNLLFTLIGNHHLLRRVADALRLDLPPEVDPSSWFASGSQCPSSRVGVISVGELDVEKVNPGKWTSDTGAASNAWVRFTVEATLTGRFDAMVTGPIQKEAWQAAGISHHGHTELVTEMTGSNKVRMMLTSEEISCVLATIHLPMADVASRLTSDGVFDSIRLAAEAVKRRSRHRHRGEPSVSVCGLNPHAGEHGLMSHGEEEQIIEPAIRRARDLGINVEGPLSPDTAFLPARRKATDVYVCMYHDQGLIPLKTLAFDEAVNVTLGLPIIRTSVDHGTAMDLAWKGVASDKSLCAAVRLAGELAG